MYKYITKSDTYTGAQCKFRQDYYIVCKTLLGQLLGS
jgi:hypothetical protein